MRVSGVRGLRDTRGADDAGGDRTGPQWEPPATATYDDIDEVPVSDALRPWVSLSPDARGLIQLAAVGIFGPALLSTCLRVSMVEPLVYAVQGDVHFHLELSGTPHHSPPRSDATPLLRGAPPPRGGA